MTSPVSRVSLVPNNLDLVRLLAALQVLLTHVLLHVAKGHPLIELAIGSAPGVPAFFFVSGFLISAAWERHPDLRVCALNRFLRLWPALLAAFVLSVFGILAISGSEIFTQNAWAAVLWGIGEVTVGLAWSPSFLRSYGVGVANGSLWTIFVEICFYVATPVIYRVGRRRLDALLASIGAISWVSMELMAWLAGGDGFGQKLFFLSPLPWAFMFVLGALAQRHLERILPVVEGRLLLFVGLFLAVSALTIAIGPVRALMSFTNLMGPMNLAALYGLVLALAFNGRRISERWLYRNDVSYGLYIFHMPVVNFFVALGVTGVVGAICVVAVAVLLATASWLLIERPALGLKPHTLYTHAREGSGN